MAKGPSLGRRGFDRAGFRSPSRSLSAFAYSEWLTTDGLIVGGAWSESVDAKVKVLVDAIQHGPWVRVRPESDRSGVQNGICSARTLTMLNHGMVECFLGNCVGKSNTPYDYVYKESGLK